MTVLNKIGNSILEATGRTKASLKTDPLEFSELTLIVNLVGDYGVAFDTLGQSFILNSEGIFTFNEIGESFALDKDFEKSIRSFLDWRAMTIESFGI